MAKDNATQVITLDQVLAAQAAAVEAQTKFDRFVKEAAAAAKRVEKYGSEAMTSKNQADTIRRQFEAQSSK